VGLISIAHIANFNTHWTIPQTTPRHPYISHITPTYKRVQWVTPILPLQGMCRTITTRYNREGRIFASDRKLTFTRWRSVEVGRVVLFSKPSVYAGKIAVIVEIIDHKRVCFGILLALKEFRTHWIFRFSSMVPPKMPPSQFPVTPHSFPTSLYHLSSWRRFPAPSDTVHCKESGRHRKSRSSGQKHHSPRAGTRAQSDGLSPTSNDSRLCD
jgi:hypothetical protein